MESPIPAHSSRQLSRRNFLANSLAAGAAFAILPGRSLLAQEVPAAAPVGRRLTVAVIGIGNRGADLIKTFADTGLVEFAAFCDVDLLGAHTEESRRLFPDVPGFQDYRELFEKAGDRFEAVIVATPDHSHFPIAMHAMARGKHVYVEKPLAQTFREAELLMALAAKTGVVTQMGNQGHSGNNFHQFKAWTEAGVIKDVTRIDAYMNSPRRWHGWTIDGFPTGETMPGTIDWDVWNAGRPVHPFSEKLHPANWRSWFEYGNGAFGDWGPHILDTAHRFLDLGLPRTIEAVRLDGPNEFIFPQASTIRFDFAPRPQMPAVEVFWYDGVANLPPVPPELGGDGTMPDRNGKIIYSKDLIFKGGTHSATLRIIPDDTMRSLARSLPRITGGFSEHSANFALACLGQEKPQSPFEISGPLTQVFLLGVIAQRLGGRLDFDPTTKQFIRNTRANALLAGPAPRPGWSDYYRV